MENENKIYRSLDKVLEDMSDETRDLDEKFYIYSRGLMYLQSSDREVLQDSVKEFYPGFIEVLQYFDMQRFFVPFDVNVFVYSYLRTLLDDCYEMYPTGLSSSVYTRFHESFDRYIGRDFSQEALVEVIGNIWKWLGIPRSELSFLDPSLIMGPDLYFKRLTREEYLNNRFIIWRLVKNSD